MTLKRLFCLDVLSFQNKHVLCALVSHACSSGQELLIFALFLGAYMFAVASVPPYWEYIGMQVSLDKG